MIEFIMNGGIGWKNANGRVELKFAGDRVSGDKAKEQRLVDEGRAKFVADDSKPVEKAAVSESASKHSKNKPDTKAKKVSKVDDEPPVLSAVEPE